MLLIFFAFAQKGQTQVQPDAPVYYDQKIPPPKKESLQESDEPLRFDQRSRFGGAFGALPTPTPSNPIPNTTPNPTPAAPIEEKVKSEPWYRPFSIWISYGKGLFVADRKTMTTHYTAGINRRLFRRLQLGLYADELMATYDDVVNFAATGYSETRTYNLTALTIGLRSEFSFTKRFSIFLGVGPTWVQSTVASTTTTAPIASTLPAGYKTSEPLDFGLMAGAHYEYPWRKFALGVDCGYNTASITGQGITKEAFAAAVLKFYFDRSHGIAFSKSTPSE